MYHNKYNDDFNARLDYQDIISGICVAIVMGIFFMLLLCV